MACTRGVALRRAGMLPRLHYALLLYTARNEGRGTAYLTRLPALDPRSLEDEDEDEEPIKIRDHKAKRVRPLRARAVQGRHFRLMLLERLGDMLPDQDQKIIQRGRSRTNPLDYDHRTW